MKKICDSIIIVFFKILMKLYKTFIVFFYAFFCLSYSSKLYNTIEVRDRTDLHLSSNQNDKSSELKIQIEDEEIKKKEDVLLALNLLHLACALRYKVHEGSMPYKEAFLLLLAIILIPLTHIFLKKALCYSDD